MIAVLGSSSLQQELSLKSVVSIIVKYVFNKPLAFVVNKAIMWKILTLLIFVNNVFKPVV